LLQVHQVQTKPLQNWMSKIVHAASDWHSSAHLRQELAKGSAKGSFKRWRLQLGGGFAAAGGHVNNCKEIKRVKNTALEL
jgi:hypothetical protein